ncbi:MAG: 50S ribosomal protein L30 [Gemmatimonadetes bacterium]|nr:50S ribosomal protein L30 [Gemmatimonadota bacterium]
MAKAKKSSKKLKITQVRSESGRMEKHRKTLRALGLRHHQHSVVHQDSPTLQGMIRKVSFMLDVKEVEE